MSSDKRKRSRKRGSTHQIVVELNSQQYHLVELLREKNGCKIDAEILRAAIEKAIKERLP